MRKGSVVKLCGPIVVIFMAFGLVCQASEEKNYLEMLKSPTFKTRVDALKIIERSALDDDAVFEYIASNLSSQYLVNTDDNAHIDEMAWHCKALASSGDDRYLAVLQEVAEKTDNSKLKNYCARSVKQFATYRERNRSLHQPAIEGLSEEMSQTVHMLRSGDFRLMRDGARRVLAAEDANELVYDAVRDAMLAHLHEISGSLTNINKVDTLSYLAKCLGASKMHKYIPALEVVYKTSKSSRLAGYAKDAKKSIESGQ